MCLSWKTGEWALQTYPKMDLLWLQGILFLLWHLVRRGKSYSHFRRAFSYCSPPIYPPYLENLHDKG